MKKVNILMMAGFALFLITGTASAADLEDLDITIKVVEPDDDINEVENELHLPDSASDTAREHAEDNADDHDGHEADRESHDDDMNDVDREDQEEIHDDRQDTHEDGVEDAEDSTDGSDSTESPDGN